MTYVLLNCQIHTTIWYYYVISVYHNIYIYYYFEYKYYGILK
jgi:hypothetical protein